MLRRAKTSSPIYDERGLTMMTTRLAIATLVAVGLAPRTLWSNGRTKLKTRSRPGYRDDSANRSPTFKVKFCSWSRLKA